MTSALGPDESDPPIRDDLAVDGVEIDELLLGERRLVGDVPAEGPVEDAEGACGDNVGD